jgi:hypothetical protein
MTRKLILGFFLVTFLLMTTLAIAGERPSTGPGAVPSKCDCLKKDKSPTSPGLRPDVIVGKPNLDIYHGSWDCYEECYWAFGHYWCFTICGYGLLHGPVNL